MKDTQNNRGEDAPDSVPGRPGSRHQGAESSDSLRTRRASGGQHVDASLVRADSRNRSMEVSNGMTCRENFRGNTCLEPVHVCSTGS